MDRIKKRMKSEFSKNNVELIAQYDMEMVRESTATRQKHLRILLGLTRILKKD